MIRRGCRYIMPWKSYTKNHIYVMSWMLILSTENHVTKIWVMISHGCQYYNIWNVRVESNYITSWMLFLMIWYDMGVHIIAWESYTKNQIVLYRGGRYYHTRIIYEESAYYMSCIFYTFTWESYRMNQTMLCQRCRYYHMRII